MKPEQFIALLPGVKKTGPNQYLARCPCPGHSDNNPSLSIGVGDNGAIILHCHAGCTIDEILEALGLTKQDIAAPDIFFKVAEYRYFDVNGNFLGTKIRKQNSHGEKKFSWQRQSDGAWKKPEEPLLYNAQLLTASSQIIIVEGEKDADRLTAHGLVGVSPPNGAGKRWDKNFNQYFADKDVFIITDNDDIGKKTAHDFAASLHPVARIVKVLDLSEIWPDNPEHGDFSDMADALGDKEAIMRMVQLSNTAPDWNPSHAAAALGQTVPTPPTPPVLPPPPVHPATTTQATTDDDWDDPIPFSVITPGEFPVDCLPPIIGDYVAALSASLKTPSEMAGVLILGVMASANQDKYDVRIDSDYSEPLCLFSMAVAESGSRKSAAVKAVSAPIRAYEKQKQLEDMSAVARNRVDREALEERLIAAKKDHKKDPNNASAEKLAYDLAVKLEQFVDIYPTRLIVNDTTPEALKKIMHQQGGCITVVASEGGLFDNMRGRYQSGGNYDTYLNGHAGEPITDDRVTRDGYNIDNSRLSTIIAVQGIVLHSLVSDQTMRLKGLPARFLPVICRDNLAVKSVKGAVVPPQIKSNYHEAVTAMLSAPYRGEILLEDDAEEIRFSYENYTNSKMAVDWAHMRDFASKLCGAMCRIAALLHVGTVQGDPTLQPISADTMLAAREITDYLAKHAENIYAMAGTDSGISDTKFLLKRIQEMTSDGKVLTKRDLYDAHKSRYGKVEAMEPTLKTLQDMGYIRLNDVKTGGRPSVQITVNPKAR